MLAYLDSWFSFLSCEARESRFAERIGTCALLVCHSVCCFYPLFDRNDHTAVGLIDLYRCRIHDDQPLFVVHCKEGQSAFFVID